MKIRILSVKILKRKWHVSWTKKRVWICFIACHLHVPSCQYLGRYAMNQPQCMKMIECLFQEHGSKEEVIIAMHYTSVQVVEKKSLSCSLLVQKKRTTFDHFSKNLSIFCNSDLMFYLCCQYLFHSYVHWRFPNY